MRYYLTNGGSLQKSAYRKELFFLVILMIFAGRQLFAQVTPRTSEKEDAGYFTESLYLKTDRDIYVSGEQAWFKIYKLNGSTNKPCDLSKVVYIELLNQSNNPVSQLKICTDGTSGSSYFTIPGNLATGNYLIRAYTNWMKNFTGERFCYGVISVINPFRLPDIPKLSSGFQSDKSGEANQNEGRIKYIISIDKPVFGSREKVSLKISAEDESGKGVVSDLTVSVARSAMFNRISYSPVKPSGSSVGNGAGGIRFLPELEGQIISGVIKSKSSGGPMKSTDISLSFVGKSARCYFTRSDSSGGFKFVIKEPGLREMVIQPLSPDAGSYFVELDQSYSGSINNFQTPSFDIDSNRLKEINDAIISMQVHNVYQPFLQEAKPQVTKVYPDFFGKAENTIRMADYIELTTVREVVKEIIPDVYTLRQNGKFDFKLINKFRGEPFENKPLILVDGVPAYDFEKVLNINSREIEKADVINKRYFYSDFIFDGIVSFITKTGKMNAMEFDNSIFRQAWDGCREKDDFYSPSYNSSDIKEKRAADFRNTLYWNPSPAVSADGLTNLEFFTSDEPAEYKIVVEGVMADGRRGYSTATFSVK